MASINNRFYDELGERWHTDCHHPIALLRAENRLRNPWIAERVGAPAKILDIGCGAGLLTNHLASLGHTVYGIDLSCASLDVARSKDGTQSVIYLHADATEIPLQEAMFDAVCAMDLLEHVPHPEKVVAEASRLLRPGGLFFFHTFNRNFWSWLLAIKGVAWCVRNTPPHMHVYPLFIRPQEMEMMCGNKGLRVKEWKGVCPKFWTRPFWKMVVTRSVSEDFQFQFVRSLTTGYCGVATKDA